MNINQQKSIIFDIFQVDFHSGERNRGEFEGQDYQPSFSSTPSTGPATVSWCDDLFFVCPNLALAIKT
jgi:hypothetical protein